MMDNSADSETVRAALQRLFKRCQTDMEFRRLCLTRPVMALEQIAGRRLDGYTIRFVEAENAADPPIIEET